MRIQRGQRSHAEDRPLRLGVVVGFVATVLCLLAALFISRWLEIRSLDREVMMLAQARNEAQTEQDALRARLALVDDPQTLEDLAREKLGWIYPGEEKVYFVED